MARKKKPELAQPSTDPSKGLFRTELAGPRQTLNDAFMNLERANRMERVCHHPVHRLFGGRIRLAPEEGSGYWDFTRIREDIYVVAGNFAYKDPRVEILSGDGLIQLYFKLSGDLTMAISRSESLRLSQPGLLIYHQPQGTEVSEWTAPSSHERFVCINLEPRYLNETFAAADGAVPELLQPLIQRSTDKRLYYGQLTLSAEMFELATRLIDNPYSGALGLLYTEGVVMQLICLAVAGIGSVAGEPSEQYSPREVRCLHAARKILMRQLSQPPTIRQVARAAGINETTLKRGFKALFGETIFDFSVRCRMQQALILLREQRVTVAEVGEAVGYRHQTSFATAFRRHFGLRPKDIRRRRQS